MIQFNELKVINDGERIVVDVSVMDTTFTDGKDYFKDVYIHEVIIDTHETYSALGPSKEPFYSYKIEEHKNLKIFRMVLSEKELGLIKASGKLFFINIITKGVPAKDVTSEWSHTVKPYYVKAIADSELIYKSGIKLISKCNQACDDQSELINYILKMNSLDLALKTENYPLAIKNWGGFYRVLNQTSKY